MADNGLFWKIKSVQLDYIDCSGPPLEVKIGINHQKVGYKKVRKSYHKHISKTIVKDGTKPHTNTSFRKVNIHLIYHTYVAT